MTMVAYDIEKFSGKINDMPVSDPQVMQSAAGYYIGRSYWDVEYQYEGPYDRLSGYFPTEQAANDYLEECY